MELRHGLFCFALLWWNALTTPPLCAQQIDLFDEQASMDVSPAPVSEDLEDAGGSDGGPSSEVWNTDLTSGPVVERLGAANAAGPTLILRFERSQGSILVPAKVHGETVYFVFDTGASYVTLEAAFAARLGLTPGASAPAALVQTANGSASVRFGLLRSLKLGERDHDFVSFATCPGCGQQTHKGKPVAGLLGRNILARYRIQIDESRGVVELAPHSAFSERIFDIRPWATLLPTRNYQRRGSWIMEASVENRSSRTFRDFVVEFRCGQRVYSSQPVVVPPGKPVSVSARADQACMRWTAEIVRATW
jgi:hypothetical protein